MGHYNKQHSFNTVSQELNVFHVREIIIMQRVQVFIVKLYDQILLDRQLSYMSLPCYPCCDNNVRMISY